MGGYSYSIAPVISYVHGNNGYVPMDILRGPGVSQNLGLGPIGFEYGQGKIQSLYQQFSLSGLGKGIDLEWATWDTNTNVYKIPIKF